MNEVKGSREKKVGRKQEGGEVWKRDEERWEGRAVQSPQGHEEQADSMDLIRGHEEPRKDPERWVTGFHLGMKTMKTLPAIEDASGFITLSSDPQLERAGPVGAAGARRVRVGALHDPAFFYKASPSHTATWLTTRRAPDTPQSPDPPQVRVLLLLQAGAGPEISPPPPASWGGLLHVPNAHRHPQAGPALPPRAAWGPAWPPEHGTLP